MSHNQKCDPSPYWSYWCSRYEGAQAEIKKLRGLLDKAETEIHDEAETAINAALDEADKWRDRAELAEGKLKQSTATTGSWITAPPSTTEELARTVMRTFLSVSEPTPELRGQAELAYKILNS